MKIVFILINNLIESIPEKWLNSRKALGMTGLLLVVLHALMSFLLFSPAVYEIFFASDGTMTLLAGVTAFVVLWGYNMTFQTFLREDKAFIQFITSRKFMLFALLLGAEHLFLWDMMAGCSRLVGTGDCLPSA